MDFAGITEYATFAGKGKTFQIWEPEAFKQELDKARHKVKEKRSMLRFRVDKDDGGDHGR
jgi:MraZ protein